ncbi:MAG: ABC-2 transporter permease [Eubacterium sp.]|nr:ABC-2 transporter permease [Eubacterium sp.]
MRGLIYKEMAVFFKSIDRKVILFTVGMLVLVMLESDAFAGLFATIFLAMFIGIQHILTFSSDEQVGWGEYQSAMPVNGLRVVGSKYLSILGTLAVSFFGSITLNLLAGIIFGSFDFAIWAFSMASAAIIPLILTGFCMPFIYWFGFTAGKVMGGLAIMPIICLVKYFEDGPGFQAMIGSVQTCVAAAFAAAAGLFLVSLAVSVLGYGRKKE